MKHKRHFSCADVAAGGESYGMAAADRASAANEPLQALEPSTGGPQLSASDRAWLRERHMVPHTSYDPVVPIRLHGHRVLQLKTTRHAPGGDDDSFEAEPREQIPFDVLAELPDADWQRVAQDAGLTKFEQRLFLALFRDQVPYYKAHTILGRTKAAVRKAYRSIQAKLFNQSVAGGLDLQRAPSSRSVVYLERLDSGPLVLSMGRLDDTFADVMRGENYIWLVSQPHTRDSSALSEKGRFLNPRDRKVVMLIVKPVTEEDLAAEVKRLGIREQDFGSPDQKRYWMDGARLRLEGLHRLEAEQQQRNEIHALGDDALDSARHQCQEQHSELIAKVEGTPASGGKAAVEGVRQRVARLRRELWSDREQWAASMTVGQLEAALDQRAKSGLRDAVRELESLEDELNENSQRLDWLRQETAYRSAQARAHAVTRTEPAVTKAIKALVSAVDGITPQFRDVQDQTTRAYYQHIAACATKLKGHEHRVEEVA